MKSFYDRVRKEIRQIRPYVPGRPIEEIRKKLGLKKVIKLASNEIPWGPSAAVRRAVMREMENVQRYPYSECPELAEALSKKLRVRTDQLVFGNGSDEIIALTVKAFIASAQDEVIVAHPTFLIYAVKSTLSGAKVVTVPMKQFSYDLERMAQRINARTRIVFLANPDNPTGTYVNAKALKTFLVGIPPEVIVLLDEAYYEFAAAQKKDYPASMALLAQHRNLIITRTFSKAYGLAGLRIGYAVSSSEIAGILNRVREPFNVNRIAEVAARTALKETALMTARVNAILKEKRYVSDALEELGICSVESATNFILILLPQAGRFVPYALGRGVIVRSMHDWGIPGAFRVTIGKKDENMLFLRVLRAFMSERGKHA